MSPYRGLVGLFVERCRVSATLERIQRLTFVGQNEIVSPLSPGGQFASFAGNQKGAGGFGAESLQETLVLLTSWTLRPVLSKVYPGVS